jgi:transposase
MNMHKNARMTPIGREHLVQAVVGGQTAEAAARAAGVCPRTVRKWLARFKAEGRAGLMDRSSRPNRLYRPTPAAIVEQVEALRRQRFGGQQIATNLAISPATVSRILRRLGLNRMRDLELAEPVRRYERDHPGDMIHIDIKKLGRFDKVGHRITGDRTGQSNSRGVGWEFVHVCIDDHSRVAFSQILPDEKASSAVPFLEAAVAYYKSLGVTVTRVMTDNGSCYKAFAFGMPVGIWASSTSAPSLTLLKPTARLSDLSRPRCGNGLTPKPIRRPTAGARNFPSGCTVTIGAALTAA